MAGVFHYRLPAVTHMADPRCALELVTRGRGFMAFFGLRPRDTGDM